MKAGQYGDAPQAAGLLEEFRPRTVDHVIADAAYDRMRFGTGFVDCGLGLHPAQPDTETEKAVYRSRYKNRNVIERFFGRIKRYRRVATRDTKKRR